MPQPDGRGVTRTTADRRYALAHSVRLPPGATFMGIGDSITRGDAFGSTDSVLHGTSFLAQAAIRLGLRLVGNAGVAGEKTKAVRARVRTDVLPLAPQLCHVLTGTNDCGDTSSSAAALSDVLNDTAEICNTLRANGVIPILGALPPRPSAATRAKDGLTVAQATSALRRMQMEWARAQGVVFVPYHEVLASPSTGYEAWGSEQVNGSTAAYSADGIHPTSPTGVHAMGLKLAESLATEFGTSLGYAWETASTFDDPFNLIAANSAGAGNARGWLLDSDENGYPDGWTSSGTTMSGHTSSITTENGVRWWKLSVPPSSSGDVAYLYNAISSSASPRGWSAGDRILACVRLRMANCRDSATTGLRTHLFCQYSSSGAKIGIAYALSMDVNPGFAVAEFTVPTGADRLYFFLTASTLGSRSQTASIEFARPALWNLTRLNLA